MAVSRTGARALGVTLSATLCATIGMTLAGCASGPPVPDWQANAKAAMDQATEAYLVGDNAAAARAFERAREQLRRSGRAELLARAELMRCATQVASLVFEPCAGFERLRADAAPPELAYADYLAARPLPAAQIELLPPGQRGVARVLASSAGAASGVEDITDPLARLIAAALLFQAGQASPATLAAAADTASVQGWRRPLLAWLEVLALRAQRAGAADEAARLRRRIELVLGR